MKVSRQAVLATLWVSIAMLAGWFVRVPYLTGRSHDDLRYYVGWSYRMTQYGIGSVYGQHLHETLGDTKICLMRGDNPVGHMAIFYAVGQWIYPSLAGVPLSLDRVVSINKEPDTFECQAGRMAYKLPAVLADLLTVAVLGWWIFRHWGAWHAFGLSMLYALHPAVIHNSAIWGQIDVWHSLIMTVAVMFFATGRYRTGAVVLALALLFKFQAIALVPLSLTCLLFAPVGAITLGPNWRRLWQTLAITVGIILLAWSPWLLTGAGWRITDPYDRAVGQYSYATLNTFNLWWLVNDWPNPANIDFFTGIDDRSLLWSIPGTRLGISYRLAGMILAVSAAGFICFQVVRARFEKQGLLWSALAMYLGMFLFATEMHERYLYAAVPLVMLAYRPTASWWLAAFFIGSAATLNQVLFFPAPAGTWIATLTDWARPSIALTGDVVAYALIALFSMVLIRLRWPTGLTPVTVGKWLDESGSHLPENQSLAAR